MEATSTIACESPGEEELLDGLIAGRPEAFERLVRENGGRMLAVARRILRNEEEARDAVQDAFLAAFRALPAFERRARLSTWLHRIVINAALARKRRRAKRPERSIDELLPAFLPDGHRAEPGFAWRSSDACELEEDRVMVREAINELPEAFRTVLILRDMEQLDTDETARLLHVTSGVVKTRLHRARQALRSLLDAHFRGADP